MTSVANRLLVSTVLVFTSMSPVVFAQHEHHAPQHDHSMRDEMAPHNASTAYLLNWSSGTSLNPSSWSMPMKMTHAGSWNLMWMGQAFLAGTQQSGPRGGDKLYSSNWGMLAAARNVGRGSVMLRGMTSLEPLSCVRLHSFEGTQRRTNRGIDFTRAVRDLVACITHIGSVVPSAMAPYSRSDDRTNALSLRGVDAEDGATPPATKADGGAGDFIAETRRGWGSIDLLVVPRLRRAGPSATLPI